MSEYGEVESAELVLSENGNFTGSSELRAALTKIKGDEDAPNVK